MASVPSKVSSRISAALKRFQPVLEDAHKRDVNESDTVTIVTDILSDMMGYDKYSEITSEHAIRSTYCDLAIKLDGHLAVLIEVKAIGLDLKDNHTKQAVDYAANEGCEWVGLTNGVIWQVYRVTFAKPIQHELVLEVDLRALSHRKDDDIERVYLISREGWQKSRLEDYATQQQALSRFSIAAVLLGDPVLQVMRRELRRLSPDVHIDTDAIQRVLVQEVIKRDVIEGDKAEAAKKLVTRAAKRALRTIEKPDDPPPSPASNE
jgi:Type I restriction enzyme R protein N terminus (HSDR_N)